MHRSHVINNTGSKLPTLYVSLIALGMIILSACGICGEARVQEIQNGQATTTGGTTAGITQISPKPNATIDSNTPLPVKLPPQSGISGIIGKGQSLSVGVDGAFLLPSPTVSNAYMLADTNRTWDTNLANAPTL